MTLLPVTSQRTWPLMCHAHAGAGTDSSVIPRRARRRREMPRIAEAPCAEARDRREQTPYVRTQHVAKRFRTHRVHIFNQLVSHAEAPRDLPGVSGTALETDDRIVVGL